MTLGSNNLSTLFSGHGGITNVIKKCEVLEPIGWK